MISSRAFARFLRVKSPPFRLKIFFYICIFNSDYPKSRFRHWFKIGNFFILKVFSICIHSWNVIFDPRNYKIFNNTSSYDVWEITKIGKNTAYPVIFALLPYRCCVFSIFTLNFSGWEIILIQLFMGN